MSRADPERLDDMREAAALITRLVARGRRAYDEDEAVRPAIERQLEILGEAANLVSTEARERFSGIPWIDITRLRIRLAHHYHRTDPERVWRIAVEEIPVVSETLGPLSSEDAEPGL
jgi:uncharacterized protein with HEPN domain